MLQLNVKNETSKLKAVVLGSATNNGATPTAEEAYDPKSLEHIVAGTYPIEKDIVPETGILASAKSSSAERGKIIVDDVIPNIIEIIDKAFK